MIHSNKHYWHHRALRLERLKVGPTKLRPRAMVRQLPKRPGAFILYPFPRAGMKREVWHYSTGYRSRIKEFRP